jgi:hypothetical protein
MFVNCQLHDHASLSKLIFCVCLFFNNGFNRSLVNRLDDGVWCR